jgi:hypothetical protein
MKGIPERRLKDMPCTDLAWTRRHVVDKLRLQGGLAEGGRGCLEFRGT